MENVQPLAATLSTSLLSPVITEVASDHTNATDCKHVFGSQREERPRLRDLALNDMTWHGIAVARHRRRLAVEDVAKVTTAVIADNFERASMSVHTSLEVEQRPNCCQESKEGLTTTQ